MCHKCNLDYIKSGLPYPFRMFGNERAIYRTKGIVNEMSRIRPLWAEGFTVGEISDITGIDAYDVLHHLGGLS